MAEPTPAAPSSAIRRIFTATLILGVPGSGKTSLFEGFAAYLWETYQRVLLLYSWDGGAIPTLIQKRMKQGLIRYWRARTRSGEGLGIETVYLATKGYWPRKIDPLTGETSPSVELVPPVIASYSLFCPKGHGLRIVPSLSMAIPMFCSECKVMVTPSEMIVKEAVQRTPGLEQVGGVAFDGLTSMANVVMDYMDHERGAGRIGGEKPAFGGVVQSGGVKMGGNNRADVGFGQSRAQQFVNNSLSIPYLVEGPVFTGLSKEATDEGGLSILGLDLPGQAATAPSSAWFGNVFEMGKTKDEAGRDHFTLFLRPFTDTQGRRHLLKTSASPTGLPPMLVDPPEDDHRPGAVANLGSVFRMLDDDLQKALAEDTRTDVPGIAGTPSDYGIVGAAGDTAPAQPPLAAGPIAPASGIAPLAAPTPAAPTPTAAPSTTTVATPRPRTRKTAVAMPVAQQPPTLVAGPAPTPPAPIAPQATAQATPVTQAPPTTGTTPPPPPGMRPPQKAPGN